MKWGAGIRTGGCSRKRLWIDLPGIHFKESTWNITASCFTMMDGQIAKKVQNDSKQLKKMLEVVVEAPVCDCACVRACLCVHARVCVFVCVLSDYLCYTNTHFSAVNSTWFTLLMCIQWVDLRSSLRHLVCPTFLSLFLPLLMEGLNMWKWTGGLL